MKRLLSLLLVVAMLVPVLSISVPAAETTADAAAVNLLNIAVKDMDGKDFSGKTFSEYDLTFLNVWATWCGPCLGEMPDLQKLYTLLEARGVNFVGILRDPESLSNAKSIYKQKGITYRTLISSGNTLLDSLANVSAIPATYFVNKKGDVMNEYTTIGSQSYENWLKKIVAIMYWEYGIDMSDLAELPEPTVCVDATYKFDSATGTLTISGTNMADYSASNTPPWYDIKDSVKHIVVSEGVVNIGEFSFQFMPNVETVSLPSSLRVVKKNAFYVTHVPELVIPEGVTTMDRQENCYCTTLSLPSTLVNVPDHTKTSLFIEMNKLVEVNVAENNPVLASYDGVLYSGDGTVLLYYPPLKPGTEYTTIRSTRAIGANAIRVSARLKYLHISGNVNTLYGYCISSMSLLREVYFHGNCPTNVDENAIVNNYRLTKIFYNEKATGWDKTFCGINTESFTPAEEGNIGDCNGDSKITLVDALVLLRHLQGWENTNIVIANSDIDGDTKLTNKDALLLIRSVKGWLPDGQN